MENLSDSQKAEYIRYVEDLQMKESVKMVNRLVEECFDKCVTVGWWNGVWNFPCSDTSCIFNCLIDSIILYFSLKLLEMKCFLFNFVLNVFFAYHINSLFEFLTLFLCPKFQGFKTKSLEDHEQKCISHCTEKYMKLSQRVGLRYSEQQAKLMQNPPQKLNY